MKTCESNWKRMGEKNKKNAANATRRAWLTVESPHTSAHTPVGLWEGGLGLLTSNLMVIWCCILYTHKTKTNKWQEFVDGWRRPRRRWMTEDSAECGDRWWLGPIVIYTLDPRGSGTKLNSKLCFSFYLWGFVTVSLSKCLAINFDASVLLNSFLLGGWIPFFY